jgi:hypothetical protein
LAISRPAAAVTQAKRYGQNRDRHDPRDDDRVGDHEGVDYRGGDRGYRGPDGLGLVIVHAGVPSHDDEVFVI